jgi:hypothetical protein
MGSANLQAMLSWSHHAFMYPSYLVIQENFIFHSANDRFSLEFEKALDTGIWESSFSQSEHPIELGQEDRVMKRNTSGAMKHNLILQGTMSLTHEMKSCIRDWEVVRGNDQVMVHPSDSEAWKALDDFDADFTRDAWNVCIGLATDGFTPYNTSVASYSCWHVFAILYNLPTSLCMKYEYIFLCLIIPGPDHPGTHINVMLKPLIEELK